MGQLGDLVKETQKPKEPAKVYKLGEGTKTLTPLELAKQKRDEKIAADAMARAAKAAARK